MLRRPQNPHSLRLDQAVRGEVQALKASVDQCDVTDVSHRWPRLTVADEWYGCICSCGNLKTDQALSCKECAAVRQIDFAIGVTFALRKTVADHDEAVGRRVEV